MIAVLFIYLVVIASLAGIAIQERHSPGTRSRSARVQVGDPIVYRKQKCSAHPGPRAHDVDPAPGGETYSYIVDKFWTVEDVLWDGRIVATTRTHKRHYLSPDDPNFRKAKWIERLRYWSRFPRIEEYA